MRHHSIQVPHGTARGLPRPTVAQRPGDRGQMRLNLAGGSWQAPDTAIQINGDLHRGRRRRGDLQ
eukprot:7235685-Pyramimonas_sp.AAC.1